MLFCMALIMNDGTTTSTAERVSTIPVQIINYYFSYSHFSITANETVSSLYNNVVNNCQRTDSPLDISIIFEGVIVLNFRNDRRKVTDIGMTETLNNIQIIRKPEYVALLEMVTETNNIANIPWFENAVRCLFDPSAIHCRTISQSQNGLKCDHHGHLIEVDFSHLNLSGPIHLESLPQTVRSLDLSFNDLDNLNLDALRGKSVEKLNVEYNGRLHVNTESFNPELEHLSSILELQLSSNQIFSWNTNLRATRNRIRNWLRGQQSLETVLVDGTVISKSIITPKSLFQSKMLKVISEVTNKEVIPWYRLFSEGHSIRSRQWQPLGVQNLRKTSRYKFALSGLGLEGHIDLGSVPSNVIALDLSDNKLSSISFVGERLLNIQELNLQHNDNIRVDLMQLCPPTSCLRLVTLRLSMNQLIIANVSSKRGMVACVQKWLRKSNATIKTIVIDKAMITRSKMLAV